MRKGSDKILIICLDKNNENNENKMGNPINYYLDAFITTCINHIPTRTCRVSQPINKLKFKNEQILIL